MARKCIANSKPPLVARSKSSCCAEPLVSESRSLQLGQLSVLQLYDCKSKSLACTSIFWQECTHVPCRQE